MQNKRNKARRERRYEQRKRDNLAAALSKEFPHKNLERMTYDALRVLHAELLLKQLEVRDDG